MSKLWAEESNVTKLIELYKVALEEQGAEVASSSDFLTALGKDEFDGASVRQIRGKLISLGEYVKPAQQASSPKSNPVRKEHYVRALGHTLGIDTETIDSLKSGKVDALEAVTTKLGIVDILAAADKGYSPRPEMVAMSILENLGVDLDELEAYQLELEDAAKANQENAE